MTDDAAPLRVSPDAERCGTVQARKRRTRRQSFLRAIIQARQIRYAAARQAPRLEAFSRRIDGHDGSATFLILEGHEVARRIDPPGAAGVM